MHVLCDQFICFCLYWKEASFTSRLTAQVQNAVPKMFALFTNARTHSLIYDKY